MAYLSFVTLLWAFSFSLIGVYLAGDVDAWFSVVIRAGLAALVFLPFLRLKDLSKKLILKIMAIGGIQLGLMYCFYYQSFLFLSVPEVLLFTVFTPLYVTLTYDLMTKRFSPWYLMTAALAVLGAVVIKLSSVNPHFMLGFFIVQGANLCFAIGQVSYKIVIEKEGSKVPQKTVFALFYIGAFLITLPGFFFFGDTEKLPTTDLQWGILLYLGLVASGLGYFFWNKGATLVNAGALAVMNNMLIPAGILVNVLIWNRDADLLTLSIGGSVILISLWVNEVWVKDKIAAQPKALA